MLPFATVRAYPSIQRTSVSVALLGALFCVCTTGRADPAPSRSRQTSATTAALPTNVSGAVKRKVYAQARAKRLVKVQSSGRAVSARPPDQSSANNSRDSTAPKEMPTDPASTDSRDQHADHAAKENSGPSNEELAAIARAFCTNNAASATEARLAAQRRELTDIGSEVEKRSAALTEAITEARNWVERREKLLASARESLVETYSKMKPEAAAQQIGSMTEDVAVSIITGLNPRASSSILNEMGSERAAKLADAALRKSRVAPRDKSGS